MPKNSYQALSVVLAWALMGSILPKSSFASQDFDMTRFEATQVPGQKLRRPPVVVWESAGSPACTSQHDRDQVMQWRQKGCVVRQAEQQRCVLVTTPQTTHSILGHLVRFCIEGQS